MKNNNLLLSVLLFFVGVLLSTSAFAEKTNFSYTTLSVALGTVTYEKPVCVGWQCFSDLHGGSLAGTYQFADDLLVVELSGSSIGAKGDEWSIKQNTRVFSLAVVKAVGSRVDVKVWISSLSSKVTECLWALCDSSTDQGTAYGGGLRFWIDGAHKFAGKISLESSKYSTSINSFRTHYLGIGYYVTGKDEVFLNYGKNIDARTISVGYAHHF